ncbi:MAG: MAPEG family protein [Oleiphilaceae bacterium]|nr:MAPEG family protein [Oleiphilaceae bacterium]
MSPNLILWPVLAQVILTLVVYMVLGARRARAFRAGQVDHRKAALDNRHWPPEVRQASNSVANQFEGPVLFYVLCLVLHSLEAVGLATLVLAWGFVLSRCAHAWVHLGSNYVPRRFMLFLIGGLMLMAMAALSVWHLILS